MLAIRANPRPSLTTVLREPPNLSVCEPGGPDLRSPLAQAGRMSAPVLLVHGDADTRVPTEQSVLMRDALAQAGRPVQLVLVPGAGHGFTVDQDPTSRAAVLTFLMSTLGPP